MGDSSFPMYLHNHPLMVSYVFIFMPVIFTCHNHFTAILEFFLERTKYPLNTSQIIIYLKRFKCGPPRGCTRAGGLIALRAPSVSAPPAVLPRFKGDTADLSPAGRGRLWTLVLWTLPDNPVSLGKAAWCLPLLEAGVFCHVPAPHCSPQPSPLFCAYQLMKIIGLPSQPSPSFPCLSSVPPLSFFEHMEGKVSLRSGCQVRTLKVSPQNQNPGHGV